MLKVNRIAKFVKGHICLREENLSFITLHANSLYPLLAKKINIF